MRQKSYVLTNSVLFVFLIICTVGKVNAKSLRIGTVAYRTDETVYTPLSSIASSWNTRLTQTSGDLTVQPVYQTVNDRNSILEHHSAVSSLVSKGVRFLVPPDNEIGQLVFYSLSQEYAIPTLSPWYVPKNSRNPFVLSLYVNDYRMLFEFLTLKNPPKIAFLIQYNYDFELVLELLERTQLPYAVFYYSEITASGDCETLFLQVEDAIAYHIVIVGNSKTTSQIIFNAKSRQMMSHHYSFYLTNPEVNLTSLGVDRVPAKIFVGGFQSYVTSEVEQVRQRDVLIYQSKKSVLPSDWKMYTVLALDILSVLNLSVNKLQTDLGKGLQSSKASIDLFEDDLAETCLCNKSQPEVKQWKYGRQMMETIKQTAFEGFSGYVRFSVENRRYVNTSMWQYKGANNIFKVASWSEQSQLTVSEQHDNKLIPDKLRHFKITSILEKPFTQRVLDSNGNPTDQLEGYCVDLIQQLSARIGFSYEIYIVPDGKYGSRESSNWNGMIREVVSGFADMAVAPLTISAERQKWVDFTKPYMTSGISIMIKKPEKESPSIFSFLRPFKSDIWYLTMAGYACVCTMLFVIAYFDPFERRDQGEEETSQPIDTDEQEFSYLGSLKHLGLLNSLWFSMSSILNQGSDILPQSIAGRVVAGSWWFFTLFIVSAYTANLAAFLTFERLESPINSATDLAQQSRIKYGCVKDGTTMNFFKNSPIPIFQRMHAFMSSISPSPYMSSNQEGIKRVRESGGDYAFLLESAMNEYTAQQPPCDTMIVGSNLDSKGYGIALTKNSVWTHNFTVEILKLTEEGVLQELKNKWWYHRGQCPIASETAGRSGKEGLGFRQVAGIFYILVTGLVLAMLIMLLETFVYKCVNYGRVKRLKERKKTEFEKFKCMGLVSTERYAPAYPPPLLVEEDMGYATIASPRPSQTMPGRLAVKMNQTSFDSTSISV